MSPLETFQALPTAVKLWLMWLFLLQLGNTADLFGFFSRFILIVTGDDDGAGRMYFGIFLHHLAAGNAIDIRHEPVGNQNIVFFAPGLIVFEFQNGFAAIADAGYVGGQ